MNRRSPGQWTPVTLLLCGMLVAFVATAGDYAELRADMVNEVRWNLADTRQATGNRDLDDRVLEVLGKVPRHEFVPESEKSRAYRNRPLPIGHGQTISQPFIVALMTDLLDLEESDRVLEIGTGSGYQAAVLAELAARVWSIEIIPELGAEAAARLQRLGYRNVETRVGDGYYGWAEHAPFDAIVVTAAASHIPPPLVRQLRPGGVLLVPVGPQFQVQQLTLVSKDENGRVRTRQVLPVVFVPLTGSH